MSNIKTMNTITTNTIDTLRFSTAGSVDDGKSTLIGRLLYDSKSILEDQIDAIARTTRKRGQEGLDLSLLTDGLIAERERHYHRCCVSLFCNRESSVHHRRYAWARTIHTQYGHRRLDR